MESTNDRLIRYLQDAHAAEVGIANMLQGFINDSDNQEVNALFQEHLTQTNSQAARLEARLKAIGSEASGGKGFFNGLMAKVSEIMHGAHDQYDKVTQNVIKAYATEHLERGMYESLIAYSRAFGDNQTAALAEQIQAEEEQAASKLWPLISTLAADTFEAASTAA